MATNSKFIDIINAKGTIIKDPKWFKLTFTPKRIIERSETHELYRELSIFTKYRKPNNILLKGFPGSGKTVTVNLITEVLKNEIKNMDVFLVNCNSKSTSEILKVLAPEVKKGTVQSYMENFLDSLKNDALIILDEVDRSNKIEDLLYSLTRPNEISNTFNKNISLILITNNLHWEDNLKDSTRSSLQLKMITFSPYSENELKRIIKERIKNGFYNVDSIDNQSIDLIAQKVCKERRGDCRVAIETVFNSAQNAENEGRKEINLEDVKKALKSAMNILDKMIVSKLKDNQLLILYSLGFYENNNLEEVHKNFIETIKTEKLNVEQIGSTMVFHIINYLDDLCLIEKKITNELENNIPRKRTEIKLNVHKSTILNELSMRGLRLSNNVK